MKVIKLLMIPTLILVASAFSAYELGNWKVKEEYSVTVYQGGTKFVSFRGLKAIIVFDEENPSKSKITASIEAGSVDPGERNDALKNGAKKPEALDIEKFPIISFESKTIAKKDNGYEAIGNLTLKGVTKEITLPFTFEKKEFKGGFSIRPKDYNITSDAFQKDLNIVLIVPVGK